MTLSDVSPAGWHADPFGRFQFRYWDGTGWTTAVSTNGSQERDPLGISVPPPGSAREEPERAPTTSAPALKWTSRTRMLVLGGAAALLLGALLPWVEAEAGVFSVTKNGTEGDGVLTLILALVIAGVFGLVKAGRGTALTSLLLGALAGIIGVVDIADVTAKARDLTTSSSPVSASVGIGLWLTVASAIAVVVGGAFALSELPRRTAS